MLIWSAAAQLPLFSVERNHWPATVHSIRGLCELREPLANKLSSGTPLCLTAGICGQFNGCPKPEITWRVERKWTQSQSCIPTPREADLTWLITARRTSRWFGGCSEQR